MMRSLFSGVSGLKSHQTRMDVIGNNIANINTVGFKSSRVTFADVLSQTQAGAASPTDNIGGTNPKQIGLGVGVGSIDLIFTDGSPQSTGKNSDIALSGNGLFVVKNGNSTYYTRNGAFEYDANGYYVLPGSGYKVQGWNAVNGSLNTNSLPTDIIVPAGKTMPAAATTQVRFSGNINATAPLITSINGTDEALQSVNVKKNTTINFDDGTTARAPDVGTYTIGHSMPISTIVSIYDSLGTAHSVPMTIERCPEEDISESYTSADTSMSRAKQSAWRISLAYDTSVTFDELQTYTTTQTLLDENGDPIEVNGVVQTYTTTVTTYTTNITPSATKIKLDDGTIVEMTDPIYVYFNSDGSYNHMVQEKRSKENTLSDLNHRTGGTLVESNSTYVTAPTYIGGNPDKLAVKPGVTYTSVATFTTAAPIHARDGAMNPSAGASSETTASNFADDTDTGVASLVLRYTQSYSTSSPFHINSAVDQKIDSYNFDSELIEDTRVTLVFDDPDFPLTQYDGGSSVQPVSVDGNPYGILSSVSADTSGIITGTYTNGQRRFEAQIAVAQFVNPAGLTKTGNNLYQESNNSGSANIKTAPDLGVNVTPSALEMSNVDLANEFSEMIITQRGFQANSKIINVGDEMLETLVNMKR